MLVVQKGIYHPLTVEAKDKYGNICEISDQDIKSYDVKVTKVSEPSHLLMADVNRGVGDVRADFNFSTISC